MVLPPEIDAETGEPLESGPSGDTEQSLLSHLVELRQRMLASALAILVIFLCLTPFADNIYTFLAQPLIDKLEGGASMIATEVAAPFLAPFKLTLFTAIFICAPFLFYQIWAFVAPGLYTHERRLVLPLLASSTVLFYLGIVFAYTAVFPLIFAFFTAVAPEGVTVMTDISRYLDFVLKIFLAFGMAFEVPIATFLLVRTGITTREALASKRPYVIVGAFAAGMLLTPPDIVSQILLAVPIWLLFEVGLIMTRIAAAPES
ncbi:MAG: twin-arginine translocase subunit TatC [Gammaproteobacteria bacterium]|nr:twin-arginine translocase subunit TatC [Gammaproteobacteria bacterium]NNL99534.1 twin-arginine translocase subunit TatC [Gammaproteobacteria bacterium]